jgi:hypothetical protein
MSLSVKSSKPTKTLFGQDEKVKYRMESRIRAPDGGRRISIAMPTVKLTLRNRN